MRHIEISQSEAFAAYRLPGDTDFEVVQGEWRLGRPVTDAFVIAPFAKVGGGYIGMQHRMRNVPFNFMVNSSSDIQSTALSDYLSVADPTIEALQTKRLEKVVLSKVKRVDLEEVDLWKIFEQLMALYPTAFVFCYHVPGQGIWCGATPEVLAKVIGDQVVTMALAGTQPKGDFDIADASWGRKEVEEQRIIEVFVESILRKAGQNFTKKGPRTIQAGQMLHIQSVYQWSLDSDIWQIIDKLHPGPAICGMPKREAMQWIQKCEHHDREHYCGYLGPWLATGDQELYINLRSMQVFEDAVVLYLGGGLTKDSDPHREWGETELKASTMLAALQKATTHA